MFCQMTNPDPSGLNFYSKNSLVREKRNITSLYSLIATSPTHTTGDNFSFKLAVPKDNILRRNESTKQLNACSSLKYFHLDGLHEYQQIEILKEAHKDTLSRNQSAKSIASRSSLSHLDRWKRRAMMASNREEYEDNQPIDAQQNKRQSEGLAESVLQDEENQEEIPAESVVIDKIGISSVEKITNPQFFNHKSMPYCAQPQPQIPQSKVLIAPQPLEPQTSPSKITANPICSDIIQANQIQIPDKISTIQADMLYDQKDFFDLVDSPIELIKQDTNRHQSSQYITHNRMEELKEIVVDSNVNQNIPTQLEQKKVVVQSQEVEKVVVEQPEPPKPKKMNFKAMMSKHKKPESQEEKQEKKKRLLLNFFDQN